MRRRKDIMPGAINGGTLFLGLSPPQHEDDGGLSITDRCYHGVSKTLPAVTLMRTGDAMLNRQYAVQQQHTLLGPLGKIAMRWRRHAQVIVKLTENVLQ